MARTDADKLNRIGSIIAKRLPVRFGEELSQAILHVRNRYVGKRQAHFRYPIAILEIDLALKTKLIRSNAFYGQLGLRPGLKLLVVKRHSLRVELVQGHATDIVVAIIRQEEPKPAEVSLGRAESEPASYFRLSAGEAVCIGPDPPNAIRVKSCGSRPRSVEAAHRARITVAFTIWVIS